jgi:predicted type IV restriction endonuclease
MQPLNLPSYPFSIRNQKEIFDVVRRKYVALTSEEWVRQHIIHYFIDVKNVPPSLMGVEKSIQLNGLIKRADIAIFENTGKALMLVECKSPEVAITQKTFEQIARYNLIYGVKYLLVSNGLTHYCAYVNYPKSTVEFIGEIPDYQTMREK